ncbi:hypothetical protein GC194_07275 [bacterium]|nr:hypothetical protein [bacterium]
MKAFLFISIFVLSLSELFGQKNQINDETLFIIGEVDKPILVGIKDSIVWQKKAFDMKYGARKFRKDSAAIDSMFQVKNYYWFENMIDTFYKTESGFSKKDMNGSLVPLFYAQAIDSDKTTHYYSYSRLNMKLGDKTVVEERLLKHVAIPHSSENINGVLTNCYKTRIYEYLGEIDSNSLKPIILDSVKIRSEWAEGESDFFVEISGCFFAIRDGTWPKDRKICILPELGPIEIEEPFGVPINIEIVKLANE